MTDLFASNDSWAAATAILTTSDEDDLAMLSASPSEDEELSEFLWDALADPVQA